MFYIFPSNWKGNIYKEECSFRKKFTQLSIRLLLSAILGPTFYTRDPSGVVTCLLVLGDGPTVWCFHEFFFCFKQTMLLEQYPDLTTKGQLISKCLFGVFTFFQKRTKTSRQGVKSNLFVHFLEETSA